MGKETVLAMDLGGTKLLIGEVDEEGKMLGSKEYATGYLTQEQELNCIYESLDDYIQTIGLRANPKVMGIAMIGQVDHKNGIWKMIDPQRKISTPVAAAMESRYGMGCVIENDVKAATLAEQRFGGGRDTKDYIYINVGTGIGIGIISDGYLIRGWQNDAGEAGHMTVNYKSKTRCSCGRYGCVEALASGSGMSSRSKCLLLQYPDSLIKDLEEGVVIKTEVLYQLALKGDKLAVKIIEDGADALCEMTENLVRVTNPDKIIFGGGVMRDGSMLEKIKGRMNSIVMKSVTKGLVLSKLQPWVGLIGGATVALKEKEKIEQ